MRSEQTVKDLELVALVIKTNGWNRGSLLSPHGQVCLVGAINTAIMGDARVSTRANPMLVRRRVEVINILCQTVQAAPPVGRVESLMHWNDGYARSKADVLKAIQIAIEQARPKVKVVHEQFLQAGTPAPESGLLVMVQEPRQPKPKPVIQAPGRPRIYPKREPVLEPMPEREKELVHV